MLIDFMRTTTFSIQIQVKAMNEASAKKKLKQWLEPSLALKKNSDITAKNLSVVGSDGVGSSVKKKSAPKRKEEPEYDEDYDEEFDDLDWESLDEEEDEEDNSEDDEDWDDDDEDWSDWDEDSDSDDTKEAEKEDSEDEEKEKDDEDDEDDLDGLLDFDDDDW